MGGGVGRKCENSTEEPAHKRRKIDHDLEDSDIQEDDNEEFGLIPPSLIRLLKNILAQYPDNGQIIKEIVQNAEDAGATTIRFVYDENSIDTIFSQGKEELKGPALYSYNDALFSNKDWKGIQMLGQSVKEKDPFKVGKFGLGFKSVFHMTDNPVIMSGSKFGIINPDERLFSETEERRTGKYLDFSKIKNGEEISYHKDSSDIFERLLNTDAKTGRCNGTLFRFVLRKSPSKLSETIYNDRKMQGLLKSFESEGNWALLFLRSLKNIEFYHRAKDCDEATLLFSFSNKNGNQQENKTFMEKVKENEKKKISENISIFHDIQIETRSNIRDFCRIKRYIIVDYYAGSTLSEENELVNRGDAEKLGYIPIVGIAYSPEDEQSLDGHVFCSLPLPIVQTKTTGLPVHLNGFFALGPDRKDLKWATVGQQDHNDKEVLWNMFLITKVLPLAYKDLFLFLQKGEFSSNQVYNMLPDIEEVDSKWKKLPDSCLEKVLPERCVWTDAGGGQWLFLREAYFELPKYSGYQTAFKYLVECNEIAVRIPKHFETIVKRPGSQPRKFLCPEKVREIACLNSTGLKSLSQNERLDLLNYMIVKPEDIRHLCKLPLILMENDSFALPESDKKLFIPNGKHSKDLLPGCQEFLVRTDIDEKLLQKLRTIAKNGYCKLSMLDQSSVATLLCKCLGKTSSFIANREKCMTADWFQKIWKYLNELGDLELFEGLPLIPMKNNKVGSLQANSLLLLHTENEREDDLVTVMKQIGFVVVEGLPGYVQQNKSLFGKYLYTCNPEGITKLLMNISEKIGNRKLSKQISQICSMAGKALLRDKVAEFFLANQPTKGLIELIKSLPIHENTNSQVLVSIDECQEICPNVPSDLIPCKTLLKCTDRTQKTFVEKLGGRLITEEELILKYLLPEIEAGESTVHYIAKLNFVVTTATSGLFNNSALASEIRRKLKSIDFVTADSGERRKPRELFEPSEHLTKLFKGEVGRFPSKDFSTEQKLILLRKLDLKTEKCVTAKDITDCIQMVAGSKDIGETEKRKKAQNIAIHLTDHIDLLNDRELKRILETESWIPIEKQRPKHYPSSLEWFADASNANPFSSLVEMHFGTASNLLGSVMPIISKDFETFQVIFSSLHRETISVAKVCQHLSCVIHDYKESERNEFIIVLKDVYKLLLQKAQPGHCSALQNAIKEFFPDAKWLWHGSGFASPKQIVLHDNLKDLDLKPFVYKLPIDMKPFEKLIEMFGGITEYSDELFIQILSEIKEEHDSKRSPEEASRDLNICERLLAILAERKLSRENLNRIVVPVHSTDDRPFMLVGIDQAVYSSSTHYNDDEDTDNLENVFHLHDRIPEWVAQKLHIKSLTSQLIGAEDLGIFEEYGQSEPLTRRISNILKDYGDGLAIFKELIQNADDACARQVKLLYDERKNENMRSQLIDPGMADLQGSALWAFNDAKFSEEDFDNIVKLSGATKEDKRDKIGKFGLGFNAVYNITDVPSFVSANKLVILDPHTTNLGKAIRDKSKPGVKIPLGPKRNRLRRLQDQIRVYDGVFGMDASLESNYRDFDGTLFRFPLRTRKQAGASEIKNLCYDKNEMKVLIQKFACEASRLLMFTQNVSLVQFYHLSENAASPDEMALLVQIEKSVYRPDSDSPETFQVMSKSSAMVNRKLQGEQMEEFQMGHKVNIACRISNKARDDFEVSAQDLEETWLLHTVIDASDCMDLASQYPQLNPVSTVAVCLDKSRKSFKHQSVKELKNHYGTRKISSKQVKLVRNLLESIRDENQASEPNAQQANIVLPDENSILRDKDAIFVKDSVWFKTDTLLRYLHKDIPPDLALALGARTARSKSILSQSRGLPFGQHEKLTVRLKRILDAYPSNLQILYELLQNADDAGASTVKLVLDERFHPSDSIFGDKWRPLQGPALVIYNDAPFTEHDIQGIQNLGEGSKSNDVLKTGQYGIGFNVVYHISDVPCLLAGLKDRGEDVLCIFDPHARFLDECSEAEPGRMFENARDYLRDHFKDIYATFLPEALTEKKSAIFRLPLRTKEMAKSSDLKNEPTTIEEILNMFESFKREGSEALLFLQKVRSVKLNRIDKNGNFHCIASVNAKLSFHSDQKLEKMNSDCLALVKSRYDRSNAERDHEPFEYMVDLQCDGKNEGRWKIVQKCASLNSQDLPKEIEEQYKNKEFPLIPVGGIAHKEQASVKRNPNGKVYCLLPLAVTSSLPVHINGKFILDYESRRRLWYTNGDGYQTSWNYYIIDNCVLPSYVQLIRSDVNHLRKIFLPEQRNLKEDFETKIFTDRPFHPPDLNRFFHLFPKINSNKEAHEYDKELIVRFYKQLKEGEVDCLPALKYDNTLESPGLDFYPPCSESKKFYIPSFKNSLFSDEKAKPACCIALAKCGLNIYSVPEHIVRGFDEFKVPLERLSPAIVAKYLKENADSVLSGKDAIPLTKSAFADLKTVRNLLRYCQMNEDLNKKGDEKQMNEKLDLEGLPLLVTEDNMLRVFDSKKFVYYDYLSTLCPMRKRSTLHIGMKDVLEECKDNVGGPVRRLTLESLDQALKEDSERWLREMEEIDITEQNVHGMFPTKSWLRDIWIFLEREYGQLKENLKKSINHFSFSKPDDSPKTFLSWMLQWCIFPIRRQTGMLQKPSKYYLTKISLARFAIGPTYQVPDIIKEIGIAEPCYEPLLTKVEKKEQLCNLEIERVNVLLRKFAANEKDPVAFLDALVYDTNRSDSRFTCLSKKSASELLHFFQRQARLTVEISQLKRLKVWEDLEGKLKALTEASRWYFVSDQIPKAGISKLQDSSNTLLLKEDGNLRSLYSSIGIESSQDDDVYRKVILPAFHSFTAEERMKHLTFLKDKWTWNDQYHPSIFSTLRSIGYFERDGSLLPTSSFFDPEVKLFKLMLEDKDFPPKSCCSERWLKFLKMLGLISKVSQSHFCEFAEKVSNISDKSDAKEKAECLIEYFRSSDDLKRNVNFHRQVSVIPFMLSDPIPKMLLEIKTPENVQERLSFQGSIEYDHFVDNCKLAWTVTKILPSYTKTYFPDTELPLEQLGVKKMSCSIVAENLANVSRSDLLTPKGKGVKCYDLKYKQHFRSVFDSSYEFSNNDIDKIDEQTCARLAAIPLVLTESNMISIASKVTLKPGWDHPPYIFSMPIELGKYAGLFKKIGMSAEPTVEQLARVLEDLESCCHEREMDPNEAKLVRRSMKKIIFQLKKVQFPDSVTKLYLLGGYRQNCKTIRLFESQDLVYFDDHHLEDRLGSFNKPRMQLNVEATEERQFVERLPESIRPKKLSQLIEERMLPSETLPNEGFAKELEERFNSEEVVSCILRLLQHQLTEDKEVTSQAEKLHELLANVSVVSKREIKTALYSLAGSIIEGSIKSRDIYIEISDDSLVINLAAVAAVEQYDTRVARAVVDFFRSTLTNPSLAVFFVDILTKPIGELHAYLDEEGIRNDGSFISSYNAPYTKGDFVPVVLHCLLSNDIAIFEVGEYVAFEVEDPAMEDKNGEPIYIYAVIEEVLPDDFYKIDVGCVESKTAHKTELYKFLREIDFQEVDESQTKEEIIKAIAQELKSAFERGEAYAKRVIKRLWLLWHPDKNPGREKLCTEIFQFIQQEVDRLRRAHAKTSTDAFWNFGSSLGRYRERGGVFARSRTQRADNFTRKGDWWVPREEAENPQPGQAKRWYRQAKYDYQAANSVAVDYCEWICFTCHQAAEKALKAAAYMKKDCRSRHHRLRHIAMLSGQNTLEIAAAELEGLVKGSTAMRYPDQWIYPEIPHDKYNSQMAKEAIEITGKILDEVNKIVN
eukprot:gene721-10435_t